MTRKTPSRPAAPSLPHFLDQLYEQYHRPEYLRSDPLEFPHRFTDPFDQEVVALVSALLAYGNVKQIRRSVEDVLARIAREGLSPSDFVRSLSTPEGKKRGQKALQSFVHRFNVGADISLLLELLEQSWSRYGSLGAHFVRNLEPQAKDFSEALNALIRDWRSWAGRRGKGTFSYLLTAPEDGSCCKRWCMFLRWMGRGGRDEALDLGLWRELGLRSDQLVIPLDTHTGRISQYLGLTPRKSLNWKAAVEVTDALRVFRSEDPVRYDFALCRLGILDLCKRSFRREICEKCILMPACKFARSAHGA